MNSFSLGLLFKEMLVLFTNTESPRAQPVVSFAFMWIVILFPEPHMHTLGARRDLAGCLPGGTCSLYPLTGIFTLGSVLFCLLSDLLKKQTVSKLSFIRNFAKSHLPNKIISLEFSK